MRNETFQGVYIELLQELYDVESQIIEALPDLVDAAESQELKGAFQEHLEQTKQQLARVERILEGTGRRAGSKHSEIMRTMLAQTRLLVNEAMHASPVLDAVLITSARKVEHYEMACYRVAAMFADMLSEPEAATLLRRTLAEEVDTDANLTDIAEVVIAGEELEDAELADEEVAS